MGTPTGAFGFGIERINALPQPHLPIDLRQQRDTVVAGDGTAAEIGFNFAALNRWKFERSLGDCYCFTRGLNGNGMGARAHDDRIYTDRRFTRTSSKTESPPIARRVLPVYMGSSPETDSLRIT